MKIHCFICLILFLCTGCKKKLTACFEPDQYRKNVGEIFKFSNCSDKFDRSEWDFGDGRSSNISEPSHIYEKPGSYEVQLTTFRKSKSAEQKKRVIAANEMTIATTLTYNNRQLDSDDDCYGTIYWSKAGESIFTEHTTFQSNGFDRPGLLEVPIQSVNTKYKLKIVYMISPLKRDSVIIEDIDPFTGAQNPSGSKAMTGLFNLSYSVNVQYK